MQFLADENVPKSVVKALRASGYSVKDLKEEKLFGIPDSEILQIAHRENRIVLTLDKDFLYLPHQKNNPKVGVILLRFSGKGIQNVAQNFLAVLKSVPSSRFEKSVSIVSENHVEFTSYWSL